MAPILEFVKGDESPPLAPKHVTAASARPKKSRETQARTRKRVKHYDEDLSDVETSSIVTLPNSTENNASSSEPPTKRTRAKKAKASASSKTQSKHQLNAAEELAKHRQDDGDNEDMSSDESVGDYELSEKPYAQKLLQYFMSSKSGISSLLLHPPPDLDINVIIDDEGHTSLHWAAAMARIKVVKLMIENGADMYRVNYKGQTALMRSVLFTNNFDSKTFDSLLTLLRTTIFNIDKKDQTVFHHIATTAAWRGKIHASRYYMECLITKLNSNRSELISILNVQDVNGDTALTIAARSGNKRLVKLLIDAGASAAIANEEGMTSRDYLNEIEKNSQADMENTSGSPTNSSSPVSDMNDSTMNELDTRELLRSKIEAMFNSVTSSTGNVPPISEVFDKFAESYEKDLLVKERDLQKKKIELDLYMKRLEETKRVVDSIKAGNDDEHILAVIRHAEGQGTTLELKLKKWLQYSQKEKLKLLEEASFEDLNEKPPSPPQQSSSEELQENLDKLQKELKSLKEERKKHTEKLAQLYARIPPKKYQDYKRLISTCCNVAYENVDLMLSPLLESFNEASEDQREEMMTS